LSPLILVIYFFNLNDCLNGMNDLKLQINEIDNSNDFEKINCDLTRTQIAKGSNGTIFKCTANTVIKVHKNAPDTTYLDVAKDCGMLKYIEVEGNTIQYEKAQEIKPTDLLDDECWISLANQLDCLHNTHKLCHGDLHSGNIMKVSRTVGRAKKSVCVFIDFDRFHGDKSCHTGSMVYGLPLLDSDGVDIDKSYSEYLREKAGVSRNKMTTDSARSYEKMCIYTTLCNIKDGIYAGDWDTYKFERWAAKENGYPFPAGCTTYLATNFQLNTARDKTFWD